MSNSTMRRSRAAMLAVVIALLSGGCVSRGDSGQAPELAPANYSQPLFSAERVVPDDVEAPLLVRDPWNGVNRSIYRFNAAADDVLLNPLVKGYRRVTPAFARQGVTNFFDNIDDIRTFINLGLQAKPKRAGQTALRLLTNTTIGIAGLFDVASRWGITRHEEDFGQTLGHYGVGPGPYVMLPLFGPSTLRDTLGRVVDAGFQSAIDPLDLNGHGERGILYYPLLVIDTRHTTAFQYFETGSPFEYGLVRKLFVTKRELDIAK